MQRCAFRSIAFASLVGLLGCGAGKTNGFGGGGGGGEDSGAPTQEGGPTLGGGDGGSLGGGPTFGTTCKGAAMTVTGTVYAPNGTDPLPNIYVYAAAQV